MFPYYCSSWFLTSNANEGKFVNTEYWYTKWGIEGRNKVGLQPKSESIKLAFSSTVVAIMCDLLSFKSNLAVVHCSGVKETLYIAHALQLCIGAHCYEGIQGMSVKLNVSSVSWLSAPHCLARREPWQVPPGVVPASWNIARCKELHWYALSTFQGLLRLSRYGE